MLVNFDPAKSINGWKRSGAILAAVAAASALATRFATLASTAGGEMQRTAALETRVSKLEDGQTIILRSLGRIEGALGIQKGMTP